MSNSWNDKEKERAVVVQRRCDSTMAQPDPLDYVYDVRIISSRQEKKASPHGMCPLSNSQKRQLGL